MRFDANGNPAPEPKRRDDLEISRWLIWPAALVLAIVGASAIQASLTAPSPSLPATTSSPLSPDFSPAPPPLPTFPPVILELAAAMATEYAPEPTATATPVDAYTPVPTPTLPACAAGLPDGTLCEWPMPVVTPEPEPTCLTPEPGGECVWRATATAPSGWDEIGSRLQ